MKDDFSDTSLDAKELRIQLSQMSMRDICVDTHALSLNDILQKMSDVRKAAAGTTQSHGHIKSPTSHLKRLNHHSSSSTRPTTVPHKQDFTIAQFRPKSPVWEQCLHPDPEIDKLLYRTPCFDCSGRSMSSVGRDEAKGCVVWVPPQVDRAIPNVSIGACSPTFRRQLEKHVERAAEIVEDQYSLMPHRTERERNARARVGADLHNLRSVRNRVTASRPMSKL